MDGDEFPDLVAAADARLRPFPLVLHVLRGDTDGGKGEEDVVLADPRRALDVDMGHESRAGADFYLGADDAERPHLGGWVDAGGRVNNCGRMDRHRALPGGAGIPVGQLAKHLDLRDHHPVHSGLPLHFRHAGLLLQHLHFDAELVAGTHGPAEFGVVDARE